jgi:serine/threonine protein kinase
MPKGGGYLAGDLIDNKYRLVRTLGEGGMGVVWVARNVVLDVDVALKLIPLRKGASQPALTKRLLQEARTAAQLSHPAICRVFDYGKTHLEDPFIVSELMHGETLGDLIETQARMPATRAAQILLPVLDGLAVAHAQGIVHRDVKPDNIFLSRDVAGRVQPKLLDFGIARFVQTEDQITVDGALLGTPNYMSPEQARGEGGADFRTDVWSVSVVLYEAVTGELPFEGENYNAILYSVINQPAPCILDYEAGDPALWQLLERGLRKNPEERWQSMRELGEALALWLYEHGVREDVCGASLRTTWIEAGLSGVPVELPPEDIPAATPRPAIPETPLPSAPALPFPLKLSEGPPPSGTLEGSVTLERVKRPHRWKQLTYGTAGAVLLAAVGGAFALSASKHTADSPAPNASHAVRAAGPLAASQATVQQAPSALSADRLAAPSDSASATPTSEADASPPPVQPYPPRAVHRPIVPPVVAQPQPASAPRKNTRRDFGF